MLFVCDVDGTMTDGTIEYGAAYPLFSSGLGVVVSQHRTMSRRFSARDGYGIESWLALGHDFLMISKSKMTQDLIDRAGLFYEIAKKHKGEFHSAFGVENKLEYVRKHYVADYLEWAAMSDDVSDVDLLIHADYSFCPNDAEEIVKETVLYHLAADHEGLHAIVSRNGGHHAVREAIDKLIEYLG